MGHMIVGISKWQWLLILIAVASVMLVNVIGIWHSIRFNKMQVEEVKHVDPELLELYNCDYPYLAVSLRFLITAILLSALAWLTVFLSAKAFFQRLPLILKYGSELLVATLVGVVFAIVSILLCANWVYDFWCGPLYGLLMSGFVHYWSKRLVFPATSVLIFWAMHLSNRNQVT